MSKYTTELRYICETLAGKTESVGYDSVDEVITSALPHLFSFDFPIFDEQYRSVLERKIVKHYYTREICAETVGLWKLYLDTKMNEIMPYYNQLYRTALLEFDPLHDIDLRREHTKTGEETGNGSNESESESGTSKSFAENVAGNRSLSGTESRDSHGTTERTVNTDSDVAVTEDHLEAYSDTPNNKLTNVTELDYLTTLTRNTASDTSATDTETTDESEYTDDVDRTYGETGTDSTARSITEGVSGNNSSSGSYESNLTSTETYIETITGSSGGVSYAKKVAEFRKNILNIDMMVIDDLSSLFFGLW